MKNIVILIVMLLAFSAVAEASVKIKKFEILKTQDGKLQYCKESSDFYQPGTYSIHATNNEILKNAVVKTTAIAVGKKCQKDIAQDNSELFIWKDLNLFTDYNYEVMRYVDSEFIKEFVTVKSENHKFAVATRSFKSVVEVELNDNYRGIGEGEFEIDLKEGILEENIEQFENGKIVSSVFFVYIKTNRTQTYSWNDTVETFVHAGPAYSFVYYIQKQ